MGRYVSPQISPSLRGLGPSSNTWYLGLTQIIILNGISIGSAVFVRVPNAMLYNALSIGKHSQNCPFPLVGFRHPAGGGPSHGDRQHANKLGKDHAYGLGDMFTDRQTHTHTQMNRQQY